MRGKPTALSTSFPNGARQYPDPWLTVTSVLLACGAMITLAAWPFIKIKTQNTRIEATTATQRDDCKGYVTFEHRPSFRLGNEMFMFASVLGIARKNNLNFVLNQARSSVRLSDYFHLLGLDSEAAVNLRLTSQRVYSDYGNQFAKYNPLMGSLDCRYNYTLLGLTQSWKYFIEFREEVRQAFTFAEETEEAGQQLLHSHMLKNRIERSKTFMVAVHIRRGDFVASENAKLGFMPTNASYVLRAIYHVVRTHGRWIGHKRIHIMLTGDDHEWISDQFSFFQKNLQQPPNLNSITISIFHSSIKPILDLYAISHCCDHVILTSSSTFGWWGAWLFANKSGSNSTEGGACFESAHIQPDSLNRNNQNHENSGCFDSKTHPAPPPVTYPRTFARPGSLLRSQYTIGDYFPPNWEPLHF